jgi:hypothetical protein
MATPVQTFDYAPPSSGKTVADWGQLIEDISSAVERLRVHAADYDPTDDGDTPMREGDEYEHTHHLEKLAYLLEQTANRAEWILYRPPYLQD